MDCEHQNQIFYAISVIYDLKDSIFQCLLLMYLQKSENDNFIYLFPRQQNFELV